MSSGSDFGILAVHLGLFDQHPVPGGAQDPLDTHLMLNGACPGEEPVAALSLFPCLGMPVFECFDLFMVVVLD